VRIEKELTEKAKNIISKGNPNKKGGIWFGSQFYSRFGWRYVSAFVMLLFLLMLAMVVLKIPQKIEFRRVRASPLRTVYPNEIHLDISELKFKWKNVPEANFYILEVFDDTLLSIWESDKILENHFQPSESLLKKIVKGKTYFWMVTAHSEAGFKTESSLVDFTVKK
jgi:hypothetical protein